MEKKESRDRTKDRNKRSGLWDIDTKIIKNNDEVTDIGGARRTLRIIPPANCHIGLVAEGILLDQLAFQRGDLAMVAPDVILLCTTNFDKMPQKRKGDR